MDLIDPRNRETYALLQRHKQRQLNEGMENARRKGTNVHSLVNSYLNHVRTNNYTGTIGQYALVWIQLLFDEYTTRGIQHAN